MNVAGVVYYQDKDLVEKTLEVLVLSGAAYSAKDLLNHVIQRGIAVGLKAGLRPALAYSSGVAASGSAADKGRGTVMTSIAGLLSLMGGF